MKKPRILLSLMTEENDYQLEQAAAARRAAEGAPLDLQILFASNDTITQSTQILRAIQGDPSLRPDAVILEPVGGTALPQVARTAVAAGIGWGVLNNAPEYLAELRRTAKAPVFCVNTDQEEIGRIQARQFAALLPKGGNLLYVQGPSEHFAAKQRTAGMQSVLPSNIRVSGLRANWTAEGASRSVSSWMKLTAANRLQVDLIAAQNDIMAVAARKVFQDLPDSNERERWLRLPFTGCDGLIKTGQAWVREGTLAATVVMLPSSGHALKLMLQYLSAPASAPERTSLPPESYPPVERLRPAMQPVG
ncbi:MAG TPA: sugar ABC transporter substrate-binding protein [Dongiaceae bacterium]|nr:sugar ABC transporter substrate-binding protein [Dongiaceae bacterium]